MINDDELKFTGRIGEHYEDNEKRKPYTGH